MGLDIVLKVAGIGIVVGVMVMILNESGKKSLGDLVTVVGVIAIIFVVVQSLADLFTLVKSVFQLY